MRLLGRDVSIPRAVLAGLGIVLAIALVLGVATTSASFAPFNPGWQGASELRATATDAGAEPVIATETQRYGSIDANDSVAFVLAPEPRSPAEYAAMRGFVERGGRLVVATRDPTAGNEVLGGLGVDVAVAGPLLRDDYEYLQGPAFPMTTTTAEHPAVANTTGLALNYGTALAPGEEARPLANTSSFSYLDLDGSGTPGPGETLRSRPVVASQQLGDGEVIVVSDPSVFINAMLEHEPNRRFATNLVGDRDRVVLDRTDDGLPPLRAALLWLRGQPAGPALLGFVLVGLVVAWERGLTGRVVDRGRGVLTRRRSGSGAGLGGAAEDAATAADGAASMTPAGGPIDGAALEAYLAEEYPEWDPERRRRVLGGVMADDQEGGDDARVD